MRTGTRHQVPKIQDNASDADLVGAVRAGQGAATFGTLVERHLASVYSVVLRVVGSRADAEDVTQEAFVRAFERLDRYDVNYSFRNWLLKIATNLALNHLRSRRREHVGHRRLAEARSDPTDGSNPKTEGPSTADWQHWLGQLDGSQRAAIVLFHFCELPYVQVAEVLDVPVNTVRTLLHRGRKRLRELLTAGVARETPSWNVAI